MFFSHQINTIDLDNVKVSINKIKIEKLVSETCSIKNNKIILLRLCMIFRVCRHLSNYINKNFLIGLFEIIHELHVMIFFVCASKVI